MESGRDFPEPLYAHLHDMMQLADEALTQMNSVMTGHSRQHDIRESYRLENDINQLRQHLKADNIRAVNDHEYDYALGTMYTDLVSECEKLGDYIINVVQARFGK